MLQKLKKAGGMSRILMSIAAVLLFSTGTLPVAAQTFVEAVAEYHRGDHAVALRGFRVHAEQGNAHAQFSLGYMYDHGQGVRMDWTEAARWYHLAAEQGDACAQLELGLKYEMGTGVRQDGSQAARWYRLAAESGVADAQTRLASIFYSGRIIPRDYGEAVRWYRAAAEQDNTHALGMLGNMYRDGKGGRQNYAEAVEWYRLGAELSDGSAQYQLGLMYESGKGVEKNLVQAHKWYNLVASWTPSREQWWLFAPTERAAAHRDGVEKLLTSAELAEAQRLARQWRPRTRTAHQPCKLGAFVQRRPDSTPGIQHGADLTPRRAKTVAENSGSRIAAVQRALLRSGYDPGPIDGILGTRTRMAIRSFQADHGLPVTGQVSEQLESAALRAGLATSPSAAAAGTAKKVFAYASGSVVVVIALKAGGVEKAQGSGVVAGRNEVVTNCHVISGADEITVSQAADSRGRKSRRMLARAMARNEKRDLCLLFVDQLSDPPAAVPVPLGNARYVSIGDEVYAIGAPRGLELSLSRGVISQLRGDYGHRSAPLIQTDAAVSPGSSGGGLFNGAGKLIGITSFKLSGDGSEGISFAMPAEWVEELVASAQERIAARRARLDCFSHPTSDCLFRTARALADTIDDAQERAQALRTIAQAQAEAGDKTEARETFTVATRAAKRISSPGSSLGYGRAEALASIARAQAESGDAAAAKDTFVEAIQTTAQITSPLERARVVREITRAQTQAGLVAPVRTLLVNEVANAVHAAERIANENLRALALSHVVEAQAEAGDIDRARGTARLIRDPSWRSVNLRTIAKALARAGDEAGARAAWGNTIEAIEHIDDGCRRAMNLAYTVEAQVEVGHIDEARRMARRIDDSCPNASAFALKVIVEALATTGDVAGAQDFVARVKHASIPDSVWGDIAAGQAEAGDIHESLRTARQIDDATVRDRVFFNIVRVQAETRDAVRALQTTEQIDDPYWRAWALRDIAAARAETGGGVEAKEILATAMQAARQIDFDSSRHLALRVIAKAQAQAGDVVGALQTAMEIDNGSEQARTFRDISVVQSASGDIAGALETVARISDVPIKSHKLVPIGSDSAPTMNIRIDYASTHIEALASIAVRIAKSGVRH